jgi:hypothetical protein
VVGLRAGAPAAVWRALLLSRAGVWLAGIAAISTVGLADDRAAYDPAGLTSPFGTVGDALVGPSARWDARWYLDIAEHGYGVDEARPAFYPLYPLLVAVIAVVVREPVVAGMLISVACLAGALLLLHRLTEHELGLRAANATTWLVAIGPMSFFFSAVYSEALFLLLSVGALLCARRDRWMIAGALALLAASTRSAGVLLVIPLVVLAWNSGRRGHLAWALIPLAGPAGFSLYLELAGAGWRSPLDAQRFWGREFGGPLVGAWDGARAAAGGVRDLLAGHAGRLAWQNTLFFGFLVLSIPCLIGAWRRLPTAYGLYAVAALALPLSYPVEGRPLLSLPRFLAVVFPLWMWLGWWVARGERRRAWIVGILSALGLMAFSALFSTWRFVS